MRNIIGILASGAYFLFVLLISRRIKRPEFSRKTAHILTGNWWFIAMLCFSSVWWASVVPSGLILLNLLYLCSPAVEFLAPGLRRDSRSGDNGFLLYPVAILLLVFLSFGLMNDIAVGGIGLLPLAYGDGLASLAGRKWPWGRFRIFGTQKTLTGCAAMFAASFITLLIYSTIFNSQFQIVDSALIAAAATLAEALTPGGFDNITVPAFAVSVYLLLR